MNGFHPDNNLEIIMPVKSIGSNGVSISVSLTPIYPAGTVEEFPTEGDVWKVDDYQTADMVMTPDGQAYKFGKNSVIKATLTLGPTSSMRQFLEMALIAQQRNGPEAAEPFSATVVVTNKHSERVDTYTDGILTSGSVGMSVGAEKIGDAKYSFVFGKVIVKPGKQL